MPDVLTSPQDISEQTLEQVRMAQADTTRAITTSSGLIGYDLESPAKVMKPVYTPALNSIPRRKGPGIDVTHWKAITAFNTGNQLGTVSDGGVVTDITYNLVNMQNTYQTIALKNSVTFQAQFRGRSLEGDLRAKRTAELIYALKIAEEQWIINGSAKLYAPPAPVLAGATTGGSIAAATNWIQVTAVSASGESTPGAAASVVTTGSTSTITVTIFTVPNAASYNVYAGTGGSQPANGSMWKVSGLTTTQPTNPMQGSFTVTITAALPTSGSNPPAANTAVTFADGSGNPLMWDGIQSLVVSNAGNFSGAALGDGAMGAYVAQPAASSGALALADIDTALLQMFLYSRANPDFLAVSPHDNNTLTNLVVAAGLIRYVVNATTPQDAAELTAGQRVTHYLNKTTGKAFPVEVWPYLPQGTVIVGSRSMPYPAGDVPGSVLEIETNQDYMGYDFPVTDAGGLKWAFTNLVDETLKLYYLGGFALLRGVTP
jgi:hypothetical protein